MALIQFEHIEDSFYAMSEMHGSFLSGRKIQISFTKSRVYWSLSLKIFKNRKSFKSLARSIVKTWRLFGISVVTSCTFPASNFAINFRFKFIFIVLFFLFWKFRMPNLFFHSYVIFYHRVWALNAWSWNISRYIVIDMVICNT